MQLISFVVLGACCLGQVRGFPAQTEAAQPSGYLNYAKDLASRGAGMLGSVLYSGLYSTSMLGTGLCTGTEMVGNGLEAGAGVVGSGLYTGAGIVKNELVNKYGKQFSMERLTRALSSVDTQSLSTALGLPDDISKVIADKMPTLDLNIALQKLLIGQVTPQGSSMNYETATIFLEALVIMVPSLKKTVEGFKTVFYVINEMKKLHAEDKPIEAMTLMNEAIDTHFKAEDPAFKAKLIDLTPLIYAAALGDKDTAWKVAAALADRDTVVKALEGMGYSNTVINLMQTIIGQVAEYASLLKRPSSSDCPRS